MARTIGYRWHLRRLMADKDMYATTQLIAGLEICLINDYAFPLSHWQREPLGHLQHTDHPILLAQTNRDH